MKKRWFTLIEMLIVIVIIGILAWALIPRIGSARDKANDTAREANVRSLATALVSYGLDHDFPAADTLPNLTTYSIPDGNFANQPTNGQVYNVKYLGDSHFVVYTALSCSDDANATCGNCSAAEVTAADATFDSVNTAVHDWAWNNFCYFQ